MKRKLRYLIIVLLFSQIYSLVQAKSDSIQFSLLTCSPSQEIYALYGHTAIRYQNFATEEDWVFNYGTFNFRAPNFIWRFVKGETDYQLGMVSYRYFEAEYAARGSSVVQQIINLTEEEAEKLFELLEHDSQPENATYRYNYFYDNCTTRARDRIEQSISGKVVYPHEERQETYRSILHVHNQYSPWSKFGKDLAIGADADKPIDIRRQMYAPLYMERFAEHAKIIDTNGNERDFVRATYTIVPLGDGIQKKDNNYPTPLTSSLLLLAATAMIVLLQFWKKRQIWLFDLLLFTAQGVAGIVIAFLFFFSSHPTVNTNWLVWVFNPLPLLALPWILYCAIKKQAFCLYHTLATVTLSIFVVAWWFIPQHLPIEALIISCSLLLYSGCQVYFYLGRRIK